MPQPLPPLRAAAMSLFAALAGLCLAGAAGAPPGAAETRDAALPRVSASAASDPASAGRPAFQTFDDTHGLPQNTVVSIALDGRGYLWVATQDGAAYYNGRAWTAVDMPHRRVSNYVNAVCPTSDGSLWFATDQGGIARLEGGSWSVVDTASGLPSNSVRALVETREPDGATALWAATSRGVARYDGSSWTAYGREAGLPDEFVTCLAAAGDAAGGTVLWAGTMRGLARFEGGRWVAVDAAAGLPNDVVQSLFAARADDGRPLLYVGTNGGLARLDGDVVERIALPEGLEAAIVRSVLETINPDGSRTLWVGTIRAGLLRLERGAWHVFSGATGPPANEISALFETTAQTGARTLWIGTNGGGLARAGLGRWRIVDVASGLPHRNVLGYCETGPPGGETTMWLGTRGGLVRFAEGSWRRVALPPQLRDVSVRCMLETEQRGRRALWLGTSRGLARLEAGRWSVLTRRDGLPGDEILGLRPASSAEGVAALWVSTGSGLARLEDGRVAALYDESSGLPHERVQCVLETRGAGGEPVLWVGTDGGLARLERGVWERFDMSRGLVNNVVLSLHLEERPQGRTLWVGTFGGASLLELDGPRAGEWGELTDESEPALPNNTVYKILADRAGHLYLTTNRGVARVTRTVPHEYGEAGLSVYTFTTADGLPGNECDIGSGYVDRRGRVWVGTTKGAAVLDPELLAEDRVPKPLVVERTLVGGEPRALDAPLDHDDNSLVFEYALLCHFREGDARYRTQLVGYEEAPTAWTRDAKRVLSNLPHGDYVFAVWARDYAGNVSGPVWVRFRVLPAPWNTWWARAGYVVLAGAALLGLGRVRTRALRRRNEVLERRIAERTAELAEKVAELEASERRALEASRAKSRFLANMSHELRTPLNAILGFVQLMERGADRTDRDREHLEVIARSGEHLLSLINDVLSLSKIEAGRVALNRRVFDPSRTIAEVEQMFRYGERSRRLEFHVEVAPGLPAFVVGDESKLRQVLINLLGNAFKFTESGGVALRAVWRGGVCDFEVEDTGPGIAPAELERLFEAFVQTESGLKATEGTGLGLTISRSYVRMMGGEIDVESAVGSGTRFTFSVPLPESPPPEAAAERARVAGLAPGHPEVRVLVVDDRRENRAALAQLLVPAGFSVREADDGERAVALWRAWRPHVVWMDIKMPGVDGCEATRRIRAEEARSGDAAARTCVLAVTASAFAHERDAIVAAGCDDVIPKPFRGATIFEKMAEHAGVRYSYEPGRPSGRGGGAAVALTRARLAAVPRPLVAALDRAINQGDVEAAMRAADRIRAHDGALGERIAELVRSYQFDEIQSAAAERERR